jgi:hypothetical protein
MKLIKDLLLYTVGMAIVFVFAMTVLFVMWVREQFQSCKTCKVK